MGSGVIKPHVTKKDSACYLLLTYVFFQSLSLQNLKQVLQHPIRFISFHAQVNPGHNFTRGGGTLLLKKERLI
jgi:hypothetical protein